MMKGFSVIPCDHYTDCMDLFELLVGEALQERHAIDPLREGVVMGLDMSLGRRLDLSDAPSEELAKQLRVDSPLLNQADMDAVFAGAAKQGRGHKTLSTQYPLSSGPDGLEAAVKVSNPHPNPNPNLNLAPEPESEPKLKPEPEPEPQPQP